LRELILTSERAEKSSLFEIAVDEQLLAEEIPVGILMCVQKSALFTCPTEACKIVIY